MDRYARKTREKVKTNRQKEISKEQETSGQIRVRDFAKEGVEAIKEEEVRHFCRMLDSFTESQESTTLDNSS